MQRIETAPHLVGLSSALTSLNPVLFQKRQQLLNTKIRQHPKPSHSDRSTIAGRFNARIHAAQ